jgi:hypothetical protein
MVLILKKDFKDYLLLKRDLQESEIAEFLV